MQSGEFIVPKHQRKTFMKKDMFSEMLPMYVKYALFPQSLVQN